MKVSLTLALDEDKIRKMTPEQWREHFERNGLIDEADTVETHDDVACIVATCYVASGDYSAYVVSPEEFSVVQDAKVLYDYKTVSDGTILNALMDEDEKDNKA